MVLFVFWFYSVCNFRKFITFRSFINVGLDPIRRERVNEKRKEQESGIMLLTVMGEGGNLSKG